MGMQCTFDYSDLVTGITTRHVIKDGEDTVTVQLPDNQGSLFFGCIKHERSATAYCWFDCGRLDATRIAMFKFLIENRICFNCA